MEFTTRNDFWRIFLNHRRMWLQMVSEGTAVSLNDADLAMILGLCNCANISQIEVTDEKLGAALKTLIDAEARKDLDIEVVSAGVARGTGDNSMLSLSPLSKLSAVCADGDCDNARNDMILIYGWNQGWLPASLSNDRFSKGRTFLPLCHLSPALWRSDLQLVARTPFLADIRDVLGAVANLFNDVDLDVLMLLERVQELQSTHRGKASRRADRPKERPTDIDDVVQRLRDELRDAGRTIALQRSVLATAFSALGG